MTSTKNEELSILFIACGILLMFASYTIFTGITLDEIQTTLAKLGLSFFLAYLGARGLVAAWGLLHTSTVTLPAQAEPDEPAKSAE